MLKVRNVAIRFGAEGGEAVVKQVKQIGDAGEDAARRYGAAMTRAADDAAAALRRQEMARAKLETFGIGPGGGSTAGKTTAELLNLARNQHVAEKAANSHRMAMMGLSYQAQDTFTQLSMGANPLQVIAIQGAQAAGQMANMGGKMGAVATVLAGPWGLAVSGGLMLLGALTKGMFDAGDAADKKSGQVKSLTESIDELNEATGRQIRSEQAVQEATLRSAWAMRQKAIDTRNATLEVLRGSRADLTSQLARSVDPTLAGEGGFNPGAAAASQTAKRVAALDAQLAKQEADLKKANVNVRQAQVPFLQRQVAETFDKSAAATGRYQRAVDDLNQKYATGAVRQREYDAQMRTLTQTRDRDTEAARKAEAESRKGEGSTRRKSDADRDAAKAVREAAQAQRQLQQDLASVIGQLDPARAAAERYADTMTKLATLRRSGDLTTGEWFDYTMRAGAQESDRKGRDFNQKAAEIFGIKSDPLADVLAGGRADDERRRAETDAFYQHQAEKVRGLSDLFHTGSTQGAAGIWSSFREQGLRALSELMAKWLIMGKDGTGGLLGSLGKLVGLAGAVGGSSTTYANPFAGDGGAFPIDLPTTAYATGTHYSSAGAALVGENGPELVNLPRGSKVTPASETRRMLAAGSAPTIVNNNSYTFSGVMTADEFWSQIQAGNDTAAMRGAAGGSTMGQAEMRARSTRQLGRRW
jgi:hypothetical protein